MVNAGCAFTVKFIAGLVAESPAASVTLKGERTPASPGRRAADYPRAAVSNSIPGVALSG